MRKINLLIIAAAIQFLPFMAHAEDTQNAPGNSTISNLLWGGVPILLLLGIFLFVLFLIVRLAQSGPRAKRADQHMDRVEQQLERIAKALEKRD